MTNDGSSSTEPETGGGRLLARMSCTLRGGHAYTASRRLDGVDTCRRCGHRRKTPEGPWFAKPPSSQPSQAAIDAGPVMTPNPAEAGTDVPPGQGDIGPGGGVDPRVLRDFLRQVDSGALKDRSESGRRRRPKAPKA
jgi:hypothetical protein